jgi:hypothetical protein
MDSYGVVHRTCIIYRADKKKRQSVIIEILKENEQKSSLS